MGLIVYTVYINVNQGNEIMLTIPQIRNRLEDRNLTKVAKSVNVTRPYLSAIRSGKVTPSKHMQTLLSMYLEGGQ